VEFAVIWLDLASALTNEVKMVFHQHGYYVRDGKPFNKTTFCLPQTSSFLSGTISLRSSEGHIFTAQRQDFALHCFVYSNLSDYFDDEVLHLSNISSHVLRIVLEYILYHNGDQSELEFSPRDTTVCSFDQHLLHVDQPTLFEVILAANHLGCKGLLDASCKTVANMIKGKSPEEIRKTFNIKNDFTPEEEEAIRKENEWAEEI